MTAAELKSARRDLGLSAHGLALALQVSDGRTIRRWEAGDNPVPGPVAVAVRMMLDDLAQARVGDVRNPREFGQ